MSDMNTVFCQHLLRLALADLTPEERRDFKANVGVTFTGPSHKRDYTVEWPNHGVEGITYLWEGEADNVDHAKSRALHHWLEWFAPHFRTESA